MAKVVTGLKLAGRLLVPILLALGWWCAAIALTFQGMASPTRPPRTIARVDTDLPPVTVDFEDVAERAGLTAALVRT
jgi:hypothetical protein